MKVKNYEAYRIIKSECLQSEVIHLYGLSPIKRDSFSSQFKGLYERIFEDARKQEFSELPSRHECVFIFPSKDNYLEWAPDDGGQCYLFELELTGELVWLDAKVINVDLVQYRLKIDLNEQDLTAINNIALKYWKTSEQKDVLKSESCEGLFVGAAKIISIEEINVKPKCHKKQTSINVCNDFICNPTSDDELLYD